jgi:hypothetical protein
MIAYNRYTDKKPEEYPYKNIQKPIDFLHGPCLSASIKRHRLQLLQLSSEGGLGETHSLASKNEFPPVIFSQ